MKVFFIALVGVFVTATFVTGFAMALLMSGGASLAAFAEQAWDSSIRYGWATGLAACGVFVAFWLLRRKTSAGSRKNGAGS